MARLPGLSYTGALAEKFHMSARLMRDLKAHRLAHRTFTDAAALDLAIHTGVIDLYRDRIPQSVGQAANLRLVSSVSEMTLRARQPTSGTSTSLQLRPSAMDLEEDPGGESLTM